MLAFAPNGMTLAVGTQDEDRVVRHHRPHTHRASQGPHCGPVNTIDFSPDGTELAVGDGVGVHLLNIVWPDNAYLRARVCGLVWRNLSRSEWSNLAPPGLQNPNACPG